MADIIQEKQEKYKDIIASDMPWWKKLGSTFKRDIQEEIDLWKSFPALGQQESGPHPALGRIIHHMAHNLPLGSTNKHIGNTIELGTIKAYGNALKSVDDMGDTLKEKVGLGTNEYSDFERGVDNWVDDAYSLNNHLPPSQMTEQQKFGDEIRSAFTLNVFLSGLFAAAGGVLGARFPGSPLLRAFNPGSAKTNWQMIRRIIASNMLDEIPSTFLDDNRDSLFSKKGQTMTGASVSSLPWNMLVSAGLGGLANAKQLKALSQSAKNLDLTKNLDFSSLQPGELYKNITNILPNTKRAKVSSGFAEDRRIIRQKQIDNQIINPPSETGETTFTDAINAKPAESTATVESDALQEVLERGASDQDLDEILTSDNVIEGVENTLSRPGGGVDLPLKQDDVSAPMGSLAPSDTLYSNQLGKVPTDNLLSLANPNNSPRLAQKITEITGKEFNQFDRLDVIKGIKAFEQSDGVSVMPNRLMGGQFLRVDEISVDPARFQYKGGVNEFGQQKGGSLEDVPKWNMNMEGRSLVWEDPADGKTYIVEGHNRLQKAKELGIPSLNVDYLTAAEAGGARAQGALSNIAAGSGTPFDAARFFKSAGINDPEEVAGLGVPLKSGMATRGLALSKLPDNIFQDAVDGTLTQGRAIALGGSGLDEAGMQTAYKALKDRDITDATFTEVIQQAKSSPTIEGDQVDLFGNTDMLNLMVEKGKLAASIRKNIVKNKNLFSTVGRNADTIEGAGSVIDRATAQKIKLDAESVLPQFDALKYSPGKISDLLNEGAQEISQGAKVNVVAKRIQREILDEIKPQEITPSSVVDEVIPEAGADLSRNEKINQIVAKAAANGEVRPPTTPLIKTPATSGVSLEKVADDLAAGKITDDVQKAISDELRLSEEFEKMDLGMKAAETDGKRTEMGWDGMTFEEKKNNGLLSTKLKENLKKIAQSDARSLRETDRVLKESRAVDVPLTKQDINNRINDLEVEWAIHQRDFRKEFPDVGTVGGIEPKSLSPERLEKYKETVGRHFELRNEISRLQNELKTAPTGKIKATGRKIQPGTPHPTDANKVRGYDSRWVTKKYFDQVTEAKKGADKIRDEYLPDDNLRGAFDPREYGFLDNDFTGGKYNEAATRANMLKEQALREENEAKRLQDWGRRIADTNKGILRQSRRDAVDMAEAMKEASKIAGIPVENIKILDQIDAIELFGVDATAGAVAKWSPQKATFMVRNPQDPLTRTAGGEFLGLNLRSETENLMDGSIYLSLYPAIQNRYKGLASNVLKTGRPFRQVFYHEAFHTVQDWLDLRGNEKLKGALKTQAAQKEMKDIITDNRGTFFKSMTDKEIEAEAFGWWKNNKTIKLKDKGLKGAFERIKTYLNVFSAKLKQKLNINPSYIDVFELAASGDIARKTMVKNLTPEQIAAYVDRIDADTHLYIPELTERVHEFLFFKKIELDEAMNRWSIDANSGGCL